MSNMKKYNGKFYKYNTDLSIKEILVHLKDITDEKGNIVKRNLLMSVQNYKDLLGEFSPHRKIFFETEDSIKDLEDGILRNFEIKDIYR